MTGVPPQLSVAVALPVSAGSVESPQASTLSAGQVITGGVLSAKLMCCTQVLMLPQASVAFQVRSMPAFGRASGREAASVWVMAGAPAELAVAVAVPVSGGSVESAHASALYAGQ